MKNKLLQCIITALFLSFSNFGSAGLIDTSENSFIDTETGLEWLDFGITNGESYFDVLGKLNVGGNYDTWRFASEDEIVNLWTKTFFNVGNDSQNEYDTFGGGKFGAAGVYYNDRDGSVYQSSFDVMGYNAIFNGAFHSIAMFVGKSGHASYVQYSNQVDQAHAFYAVNYTDYEDYVLELRQEAYSYMLVKKVPEPSSIALIFLAIWGLSATFRYEKYN